MRFLDHTDIIRSIADTQRNPLTICLRKLNYLHLLCGGDTATDSGVAKEPQLEEVCPSFLLSTVHRPYKRASIDHDTDLFFHMVVLDVS
jgi:hypothetical protein